MKKIKFAFISVDINIDSSVFIDIVIENKIMLYDFLRYCYYLFNGKHNYIFLHNDGETLDNERSIHFVHNLLNLDLNSKKNINSLYKILKLKYYEELKESISSLTDKARQIIDNISLDFDVELYSSSEIKEDDIFKAFDLKFLESEETALKEKLIKYCKLIFELQRIDIFIFNGLHQYLQDDEISSLYYELSYHGIKIINIESVDNFQSNNYSQKYIIDKELCLIR